MQPSPHADRLILLSLQGAATPAQEQELARWRRSAPENEHRYQNSARLWRQAEHGTAFLMPGPAPAAAEIITRADEEDALLTRRKELRQWGLRAAGAAALLVIGIGVAQFRTNLVQSGDSLGFAADEFVTGPAETATVALRDGSIVRLAPDSRLRLTGTLEQREVFLTGRAYFAVARREGRPFRITSAAGEVTVLGTRFDLATVGDDLNLIVVEGRVAVTARGQETLVEASQLGRVVEGALLPVVRVPNPEEMVDWVGNFLAFQGTPLHQAAREIERQYDVRIEILDGELAQRTITTWLADRSLDEIVRIVCAVAVAECVIENDVVTMQPKSD